MKEMNEQQTDQLIAEAIGRLCTIESINKAVMRDVRRIQRRKRLLYWSRAAAFSFGLPSVLLVFAILMNRYVIPSANGSHSVACIVAIPTVALLFVAWKAVSNFSAEQNVIKRDLAGLINEVQQINS